MAAKDFMEQLVVKSTMKRKGRALLLDYDSYCAWHKMHYNLSTEECHAKWRKDKKDGNVQSEIEDGKLVIAVRQPTEISSSNSISTLHYKGTDRDRAKFKAMTLPRETAMASDPTFSGIRGSAALRIRGASQAPL